jgi:DNA-binding beta-propeller fold protein YncE
MRNFSQSAFGIFVAAFAIGILFAIACGYGQDDPALLSLEKEIPLPGVEGRIDHLSADINGKRIFIAALGNGTIEVVDITKGQRTAEIRGLKEPQGVYYEPGSNRLYVASAGDGTLRIYDGTSLDLQTTLEFGDDADNVRYDENANQIWVGYGDGALGIVAASGQKAGNIALGSHPESFQLERAGSRLYVNVPKEAAVVVIDRAKSTVISRWALDWTFANYPMSLDEGERRLFVGCRMPARLVILDTLSGQVVAKVPIVGDPDDVFFDPIRRLVYVIGGEGAVDLFRMRDPNHYEHVGRTKTATGARTGLFVSSLDRLFIAAPHRGSQAAKLLVYRLAESVR